MLRRLRLPAQRSREAGFSGSCALPPWLLHKSAPASGRSTKGDAIQLPGASGLRPCPLNLKDCPPEGRTTSPASIAQPYPSTSNRINRIEYKPATPPRQPDGKRPPD